MGQKGWVGSWKVTYIHLVSVKKHSIETVEIDDSSFKVVMELYAGMLKLGLLQVGFLNLVLWKGGGKSASTISFDWKLLEACNFSQSNFNWIIIELSQKRFACISNLLMTSSLIVQVVKAGESGNLGK